MELHIKITIYDFANILSKGKWGNEALHYLYWLDIQYELYAIGGSLAANLITVKSLI